MKQFEPVDVTVNGYDFHIFPFPAFKAANMSGELVSVLGPALGSLLTLLGNDEQEDSNLLDVNLEKSAPAIAGAFSSISGDKIEGLLKRLLISGRNISVERDDEGATYVTEDALNEIFCGSVEGMFILAFHVIKTNFGGFFKKFENLSGVVGEKFQSVMTPKNTDI